MSWVKIGSRKSVVMWTLKFAVVKVVIRDSPPDSSITVGPLPRAPHRQPRSKMRMSARPAGSASTSPCSVPGMLCVKRWAVSSRTSSVNLASLTPRSRVVGVRELRTASQGLRGRRRRRLITGSGRQWRPSTLLRLNMRNSDELRESGRVRHA
jgi:hypothetical protein